VEGSPLEHRPLALNRGERVFAQESIHMFLRRFVLVVSIAVTGSLAFTAAAIAAGGGLGPGTYSFSSRSADASFGMASKGGPVGPSWSVSVNQGLNSIKQADKPGGPFVQRSTMVFVSEFDADGNGGYGCFVVPDSAFTLSNDLQNASLHAVLTEDEICGGYAKPVGSNDNAGMAGGESGLTLPLTVDVTWSATSATSTYKNVFTFRCLTYGEDGNGSFQNVNASATGAISAFTGSFASDFADATSGSSVMNIRGLVPDACIA
jgi:hypothetical protein